ncbi:MAG: glycogen/starch/alpha-glucan phosphorylase [Streptococcus thermophilus]
MVGYTNHTILAEALEKWPLDYLEEVVPHLVVIIKKLMLSFVANSMIHVFKLLTNITVFTWPAWISTSLQA